MEQSPALERYLAEYDHWKGFLVTGEQDVREQKDLLAEANEGMKSQNG